MSLLADLRKRYAERSATEIAATFATAKDDESPTVASIATVTVATSVKAEIVERRASAVVVKLFADSARQPPVLLVADDESAIRKRLESIEETDPVIITEVMHQCQTDADARSYFIGRATEERPHEHELPDDRRTCAQCANFLGRRCLAARRGDLVANRNYEPVADILQRCACYLPGANDSDLRTGQERWPGLTDTKETK